LEEAVPAGTLLLKYKTVEVYPRLQRQEKEDIYAMNQEPCMILKVETHKRWFCLDAMRRFNTHGRLLNHVPPRKATAKPTKLLFVKGVAGGICGNKGLGQG